MYNCARSSGETTTHSRTTCIEVVPSSRAEGRRGGVHDVRLTN